MNNLPKVVAQQSRSRASNPRLLDRKSDALPLSHRATYCIRCSMYYINHKKNCSKHIIQMYEISTIVDIF